MADDRTYFRNQMQGCFSYEKHDLQKTITCQLPDLIANKSKVLGNVTDDISIYHVNNLQQILSLFLQLSELRNITLSLVSIFLKPFHLIVRIW